MTTISTLPAAPSTASSSTFATLADAFVAALATFVSQTNTVAGEVNTNATTAITQAAAAVVSAAAAAASAAASATNANYHGAWSGLTGAATVPYSVSHLNKNWQLLSNIADIAAKIPGTATEWQQIGSSSPGSTLYLYNNAGGF